MIQLSHFSCKSCKKICLALWAVIFLLAGTTAVVAAPAPRTPARTTPAAPASATVKPWTFMVFMAADNNLEASAEADMNEMETIGSNDDLNIVVQIDRLGKEAFNRTDKWSGARRFFITKDQSPKKVTSKPLADLGEIDMAAPQALLDFVKWTKTNYPAKRYALILWNHGTGWKEISPDFGILPPSTEPAPQASIVNLTDDAAMDEGINYNISYDDTSGSSMDIPSLGATLKAASRIIGRKFDLIGFDACLMQMAEVAYEIAPASMYQVAAPDREPDRGWPYDDIIGYLANNPTVDGKQLGEKIVSAYKASYQMGSQGNTAVILSLIDLSRVGAFMKVLNAFSKAVQENIHQIDKIEQARLYATKYVYDDYLDLEHFLKKLTALAVSPPLKKAAENLIEAISGRADSRLITINGSSGEKFKGCGGIAVFFPERNGFRTFKKRYKLLQMSGIAGSWYDFLTEYETPNLAYLKITDVILDDKNQDGKIAPGEAVKVFLKVKNLGKLKATQAEIECSAPKEKVTFAKASLTVTNLPAPGKESTIGPLEFTVDEKAELNTEIQLKITLQGDKVPVSTCKTSFFVKSSFVTSGHVLLVFADNFSPAAPVLQNMFNTAGIKFDLWDRMLDGNLKPEVLKRYLDGWVYLAVQDSSNQQQLASEEIEALEGFLKSGGRLVLSGQDLAFSLRDTVFLKDYCKVSFIQDDTNVLVVNGLGFAKNETYQIYGGDGANNQKWPDEIDARAGAKLIMKYDNVSRDLIPDSTLSGPDVKPGALTRGVKSTGGAAVQVVDGYRLMLFAFGVEAVSSGDQRTRILKEIQAFMVPPVNSQIRDYAGASDRRARSVGTRNGRQHLMEDADMLRNLRVRITRQVKEEMEEDPNAAFQALSAIEELPEEQRSTATALEKDVRSLLEFQKHHGTVMPK